MTTPALSFETVAAFTPAQGRAKVHGLYAADYEYELLYGIVVRYELPDALFEDTAGLEVHMILDHIFRQCNHVDGTEWISTSGIKARSLSCGDVVEFDGRFFLCESIGWGEISKETAEYHLTHVNSRMFVRDILNTVRFNPTLAYPA